MHQRRQQLAPFAEQGLQRAGLARHLLAQVFVQTAVFPHQQHPSVHHQRRKAGDQRKGPVLLRPGPELGLQIARRQRRDREGKAVEPRRAEQIPPQRHPLPQRPGREEDEINAR